MLRRVMVLIGLLGVFRVQEARAWTYFFDNYCVTGALQVCASVRVMSSGSTLTMQVWNLEGVMGGAHTITSVGLYHSGTGWDGDASLQYAKYYAVGGGVTDVTANWKKKTNDINTLAGIDIEAAAGTTGNSGINGCTLLPGGTKWQTCNSFSGLPYMEFKFNVSEAFGMDNLQLRWHSQQVGPNQQQSLKCDTGGAGDYPPCVAVPEPVTSVLLVAGLAGLGGAGFIERRRRRRRQNELV